MAEKNTETTTVLMHADHRTKETLWYELQVCTVIVGCPLARRPEGELRLAEVVMAMGNGGGPLS